MRNAEWNKLRLAAAGMVVAAIIVGGTGLSCDENAQNMFRTTATPAVTTGVKTVVDGAVTDTEIPDDHQRSYRWPQRGDPECRGRIGAQWERHLRPVSRCDCSRPGQWRLVIFR